MSQAQQREEAAAKEAIRQANLVTPTPSPHPVTPVELETIQSESDKCRIYWKHLTMILETFLSQTTTVVGHGGGEDQSVLMGSITTIY
jgi:hypothetical protein